MSEAPQHLALYVNKVMNEADGRRKMFSNKTDNFSQAVDCQDEKQDNFSDNYWQKDEQEECSGDISRTSSNNSSMFSNSVCSLTRSDTHDKVNILLGEFRIKHSDLEFRRTITDGPLSTISKGRWINGGDVVIHSCCPKDDDEVKSWLADVHTLTKTRHENVVLYMGACVEPPKFAIVTSPIKVDRYLIRAKDKKWRSLNWRKTQNGTVLMRQ